MSRRLGIASWWGLAGVFALVGQAIYRLGPKGLEAVNGGLSTVQWAVLVVWVGFMVYSEGYRGFHLRFSPMVVARAETLSGRGPWWHKVLAPAYCMGLFHATRRRLILSWGLLGGISVLVVLVRQLDQPWRGIVDAGVVFGLAAGLASMAFWVLSERELVSPELPG